ncbi:hypothetical protein [Kitasatospora sp. NPDC057541]|uniref:hypothetical protein n=1 Tax=Kitasatospora sp. NPDC057541 TaxID=3346161 RepID=UPI0036AEFF08
MCQVYRDLAHAVRTTEPFEPFQPDVADPFACEMVAAMTVDAPGSEVLLETSRLLLRPWRVDEAVVQREL